jgi:membrane associated rhomboid family serine protease
MNEPFAPCTIAVIVLTGVCSFFGFRSRALEEKYIFQPENILAGKEYYRLVSSAFLHADWWHLIFNMLSLYFFGPTLELVFGASNFLMIYFGSILGGGLLSLYVHRHHDYRAHGASGGVCGIIFAYILLFPGSRIGMFFVPFMIPGWLYAIAFMLVSFYGMKEQNKGNIGHDAHLGGAIIGLLLAAAAHPEYVRYNLKIFLIVLVAALLLLVYLWFNPLFLPVSSFLDRRRTHRGRSTLPKHKKESLQVDAVLEKISKRGIESLTAEEKSLLEEVSGKFQRRADAKKPESGLTI